jgi:HPt (histidine-containing phosphotransfer) domain-containing protein
MTGVDALPELPGIDKADGLRRMMNKPELYERILRDVHTRTINVPEAIRAALAQGDFATAERQAHTTKGLAGTIEAIDLQKAAAALEKELHGSAIPSPVVFAQFEQDLRTVNEGIAAGFGIKSGG